MRNLSDGVDLLVTNIDKFERLKKERRVDLSMTSFVVFDEADVFIETGQVEQLIKIVREIEAKQGADGSCQFLFVTATLTKKLELLLNTIFPHKITKIQTRENYTNLTNLEHFFIEQGKRD